jgi:hypothetical protein
MSKRKPKKKEKRRKQGNKGKGRKGKGYKRKKGEQGKKRRNEREGVEESVRLTKAFNILLFRFAPIFFLFFTPQRQRTTWSSKTARFSFYFFII